MNANDLGNNDYFTKLDTEKAFAPLMQSSIGQNIIARPKKISNFQEPDDVNIKFKNPFKKDMAIPASGVANSYMANSYIEGMGNKPSLRVVRQTTERNQKDDEKEAKRGLARLNLPVVVIGSFVFIAVIAWFEWIRWIFDETYLYENRRNKIGYRLTWLRFFYAIYITGICILASLIVYKLFLE